MSDLIDRQAAIDDIRTMIPKDAQLDIKWIEMWLMQLPSVTPEKRTEERTETHACDCISRQAAIDALDKRFDSIPMDQTTEILLLRKDLRDLPPVTPKQPDCAKCKSELANKIRGQQDNPGMLAERDKGRNWGLEWAAQIVEGKR